MILAENPLVLVALTFLAYYWAQKLQHYTGLALLNPIIVAIAFLIAYLKITGVNYAAYAKAGGYIDFWLKPAIVSLAIPLHIYFKHIRRQLLPLLLSQIVASWAGLLAVVYIAKWLGASRAVLISLAPKSVTTPIAMEICASYNGVPALTAAVVLFVGLFGALSGIKILQIARIKNPMACSLGMGTASHAMGTARIMQVGGAKHGAFATIGLIVNGVLTAIFAPLLLRWMGLI